MATRQLWRERVEAWQRSGLTRGQFAARHDINPSTLSWWKWRLRRDHDLELGESPQTEPDQAQIVKLSFVEIDAGADGGPHRPSSHPDERIELVVDEHRVLLPQGFHAHALHRLLDVLEVRR